MEEQSNSQRPPNQKGKTFINFFAILPYWINISGVKQACDGTVPRWWHLMWLAAILTGITFPVYQISTQVSHYLSRPITVRLMMKSALQMSFPPVTFCNLNMARRSALDQWNLTHLVPYLIVRNARQFGNIDTQEMENLSHYNWEEVYQSAAHQLEDILVSVSSSFPYR